MHFLPESEVVAEDRYLGSIGIEVTHLHFLPQSEVVAKDRYLGSIGINSIKTGDSWTFFHT